MFVKENVNPQKRKTSDCVTRSITKACSVQWTEALQMQCDAAKKSGYAMDSTEVIDDILQSQGFCQVKLGKVAAGQKRPKVSDIAEMTKKNGGSVKTAVCYCAGHIVTCTAGNIYDIWDCSEKAVYRYWIK